MAQSRRRAGLAQKTKARRFIPEISLADDFQGHRTVQIDVIRLVSNPHRAATQLDRFPIFPRHQFVMLKSLHLLIGWSRLHCTLGSRRLAGLNCSRKTRAKHADGTEFHRCRNLVTAAGAGALGLRTHGLTALSRNLSQEQRNAPPSGAKSASTAPGKL